MMKAFEVEVIGCSKKFAKKVLALETEKELHNTICIPNQNLMNFNNSLQP